MIAATDDTQLIAEQVRAYYIIITAVKAVADREKNF